MTQKKPSPLEQILQVGQLLKAADRHTLAGDFDRALHEVRKALEVDPKNAYALAYEDRIATFRKEAEQKKKEEAQQAEFEAKLKAEREAKRKAEEEAKVKPDLLEKPFEERKALYQKELAKEWEHGRPSAGQYERLEHLRRALDITDKEHERAESHAKLNTYIAAIKVAWEDGRVSPANTQVLEELRRMYEVSSQEHLAMESQILWQLKSVKNRGTVLVVDDDEDYNKLTVEILRSNGYTAISCISPEEALKTLGKLTPDLILLDINFPKPSMSGFLFYEKIREREELDIVPVIFVSALTEDHIVQAGKQLGADDYITKPYTGDRLITSMEGRLRRYHLLKSRRRRTSS